jgi:single-strand DNA-binding protein
MSNLKNSVRLMGNLGAAPEIKNIADNKKLAKFSLATNEVYKNEKGEKVTETYWHNVVVWGKLAGIAEKYLQKGSEVAIEGKLTNHSYTDKDGNKRYVTEILANEILMMGSKS